MELLNRILRLTHPLLIFQTSNSKYLQTSIMPDLLTWQVKRILKLALAPQFHLSPIEPLINPPPPRTQETRTSKFLISKILSINCNKHRMGSSATLGFKNYQTVLLIFKWSNKILQTPTLSTKFRFTVAQKQRDKA